VEQCDATASPNTESPSENGDSDVDPNYTLTLRLLMSYIYGAPSKARNAIVVYIWTYVWQR